ncbi:MAG: TRAP transporter large permease subunit [Alphaproteobacteria bacterium]|nr:MAG: TRAP transporter large permease subunit [Alphaproteobacteria bacterium]
MGPEVIFYSLALLIALVLLGVHIGIALGVASAVGVFLVTQDLHIALSLLGLTSYEAIRSDALAVIPLFIFMGEVVSRSGAARDLFVVCERGLKRLPGRLAAATVLGNTAFAAVSGVAIASAATFGRVAYPEMRRLGYDKRYALGVIAGSACLGMLIPPSVLLIIWAILTEGSVGALFIGGIGPGLLLGLAFLAFTVIAARLNPALAPAAGDAASAGADVPVTRAELLSGLGILALVVIVLGGLWGGFFTPTEAAGFGALGSILVGALKRMGRKAFMEAVYDAGRSTAPIMFLLIAGAMYSRFLAMSGGVNLIQELFTSGGVTLLVALGIMTGVWLVLGALVDSISVILMTVPIFAPIAEAMGVDAIAFAIYGILIIEAGLLTPPVGLLVFTLKSAVPDTTVSLKDIFRGAVPYWLIMLLVALIVWFVPALASWLPAHMLYG